MADDFWGRFYAHELSVAEYWRHTRSWQPFLKILEFYAPGRSVRVDDGLNMPHYLSPKGARVAELGVGTGMMSCYMAMRGRMVWAVENNKKVIAKAMALAKKLGVRIDVRIADIFSQADYLPTLGFPTADVCFHQGLAEHFNGPRLGQLLNLALDVAPICVFCVPTNKYKTTTKEIPTFLRTSGWWKKLLNNRYEVLQATAIMGGKHFVGAYMKDSADG